MKVVSSIPRSDSRQPDWWLFFRKFCTQGTRVGSVVPSSAAFAPIIRKGRPDLEHCYQRALREDPSLTTARVTVSITVGASLRFRARCQPVKTRQRVKTAIRNRKTSPLIPVMGTAVKKTISIATTNTCPDRTCGWLPFGPPKRDRGREERGGTSRDVKR